MTTDSDDVAGGSYAPDESGDERTARAIGGEDILDAEVVEETTDGPPLRHGKGDGKHGDKKIKRAGKDRPGRGGRDAAPEPRGEQGEHRRGRGERRGQARGWEHPGGPGGERPGAQHDERPGGGRGGRGGRDERGGHGARFEEHSRSRQRGGPDDFTGQGQGGGHRFSDSPGRGFEAKVAEAMRAFDDARRRGAFDATGPMGFLLGPDGPFGRGGVFGAGGPLGTSGPFGNGGPFGKGGPQGRGRGHDWKEEMERFFGASGPRRADSVSSWGNRPQDAPVSRSESSPWEGHTDPAAGPAQQEDRPWGDEAGPGGHERHRGGDGRRADGRRAGHDPRDWPGGSEDGVGAGRPGPRRGRFADGVGDERRVDRSGRLPRSGGAERGGRAARSGRPGRRRRGDVRTAALLLIAEEPRNGYQIIEELSARTNGAWRPSSGAIYPALAQLEDEGLIEAFDNAGRKAYRATEAGEATARRSADQPRPWEQAAEEAHDAFGGHVGGSMWSALGQVGMAARVVTQAGDDDLVREATTLLEETKASLYRLLADGPTGLRSAAHDAVDSDSEEAVAFETPPADEDERQT